MAVVSSANVRSANADGDIIPGPLRTASIEIQAGGAGMTVLLHKGLVGGAVLFQAVLGANESHNYVVPLRVPAVGVYVQISAGAGTVYLYSK